MTHSSQYFSQKPACLRMIKRCLL